VLAPDLPQVPPYLGARTYPVADELLDDPEALKKLLLAMSEVLSLPEPKKPRGAHRE
jgi:hypothetical protein